jgi:lysophospholipase L1-like esterase
LVVPVRPRVLLLYAGDNDLEQGASPEAVRECLAKIVARKRAALGATPTAFVSIKVSRARLHFMHKIAYTNRIIERLLADEPDVTFLDITRRMVGRGMLVWNDYYTHDPLHMNTDGYRVWGKALSEHLAHLEHSLGPLSAALPDEVPAWAEPVSDGLELPATTSG